MPQTSPPPSPSPFARALPLAVMLLSLCLTLILWWLIAANDQRSLDAVMRAEADSVAQRVLDGTTDYFDNLRRVANRWNIRPGGTPLEELEADMQLNLRHFPGIIHVDYVDPNGRIMVASPATAFGHLVGASHTATPTRRETFEQARTQHDLVVTPTISLLVGGRGFLSCVPVYSGEKFAGYLVGVFRYPRLFADLLSGSLSSGFGIRIREGGQIIFETNEDVPATPAPVTRTVRLPGAVWDVEVRPGREILRAYHRPLPFVALGVGLLFTVLLTGAVHLAQLARERAVSFARANRLLEQEIIERRRVEVELEQARREADAANEAKSRFLATMSHEIRTPMNGILGLTDLTLESELTPDQTRYLTLIRTSAEALMRLMNDILDFSKIEFGKLQIETSPFVLRDVVGDAVSTIRPQADAKGLKLSVRVDPEVPGLLDGDALRLRQVLLNLLSNGVKFTERGEVSLQIDLERADDGEVRVAFAVHDTGIGIPPSLRQKIFEPFTQGDVSVTRRHGGTGLGLSISQHLVQRMGGELTLESAVGEGSTFAFTLPFHRTIASQPLAAGVRQAPPQPPPRALQVLVAEDNLVNQALMRSILELGGHTSVLVSNGREALDVLATQRFDAVLMDLEMPEMGGLEATRRIRAQEAASGSPHVPIIAVTAHALEGDRERCLAEGADAYVSKPLRPNEFLKVLQTVATASARTASPSDGG